MTVFLRLRLRLTCIFIIAVGTAAPAQSKPSPHSAPAATEAGDGQPQLARRQILMLRPGLDTIWGTFVLAVTAPEGAAAVAKQFSVFLPKEVVDFQPQEGLEPTQVQLDPTTGALVIARSFPGGTTLMTIAFKTAAFFGRGTLTFTAATDLQQFSVMVPRGELHVSSGALASQDDPTIPRDQYSTWTATQPLAKGDVVTMTVDGVPEGRGRLWGLGGIFAGLLCVIAGVMAWRTKTRDV